MLGSGHLDRYISGEMMEVIFINGVTLTDDQIIRIQYYLSKKWGLESTVDSDGDGVNDNEDSYPIGN